jgi:hypothetical protein
LAAKGKEKSGGRLNGTKASATGCVLCCFIWCTLFCKLM